MSRIKADKIIKRNHRVYVRFTDAEFDLIAERVTQAETNIASYVHDVAINRTPEICYHFSPPSKDIAGLASAIGKTGSNLNQIARYFNDGGADTEGIRTAIHRCIDELFSLRKDLLAMTSSR